MKARFIGMVVMMAVCVSCAMQRLTPAEKEARQQQMAQMVADSLEDAHFRVVFDYVIPTRMQPRHLTGRCAVLKVLCNQKHRTFYYGFISDFKEVQQARG